MAKPSNMTKFPVWLVIWYDTGSDETAVIGIYLVKAGAENRKASWLENNPKDKIEVEEAAIDDMFLAYPMGERP